MASKFVRLVSAAALAALLFKNPMGEHISMAGPRSANVAQLKIEDQAKQAAEQVKNLFSDKPANREAANKEAFLRFFTLKNIENARFASVFGPALGEARDKFNEIFEKLYSQFEKKGSGFLWDETERIVAITRSGIPLKSIFEKPGARIIGRKGEIKIAHDLAKGTNPAAALKMLGLIGINSEPIGGPYSKDPENKLLEKNRYAVIRNVYAELGGKRVKGVPGGFLGGDAEFRSFFEIDLEKENLNNIKTYIARTKKNEKFNELVMDIEEYLNSYAKKGSKAAEFSKALEETVRAIGSGNLLSQPDSVLDKKMSIALAVYFMVQKGQWETGKEAFLDTLKTEIGQEQRVADIKRKIQSTPRLTGVLEPSFDAPKIPRALAAEEKKLVRADQAIYESYIKNWLTKKLAGEYELYDLVPIVKYVSDAKRKKTAINDGWLDNELNDGKLKDYMDKKLPFQSHQPVNKLLNGLDIFNTVNLIVPEQGIDSGLDTNDRINAERVRTLELLLNSLPNLYPEFADQKNKLKVPIDGVYNEKETEAVKTLQNFLYMEAESDVFFNALQLAGLSRGDIEQDGRFTKNTAYALAIWLSLKRGTLNREMKKLQVITEEHEIL